MAILVVAIILVVLILWFVSAQRKLVAMDENINNAMSQIGVQLSSRWDAPADGLPLAAAADPGRKII